MVDDRTDVITTDTDVIQGSDPEDFNVVISTRDEIDVDALLTHCMATDKQACVQMVAKGDELDLSEVAKVDIKQLHLMGPLSRRSRLLSNSDISFSPSLTHLILNRLEIDKLLIRALSKAAQTGNLESLSQLRFVACKGLKKKLPELFQTSRWPHLTELDLYQSDLDPSDIQVLCDVPLPCLTSLALSLDCVEILKGNWLILFSHRWTKLSRLSLHGVPFDSCAGLYEALTRENFPSLQSLHMSTNVNLGLNTEGLSIIPSVSDLALNHFRLEADLSRFAQSSVIHSLTKLNLSHCSGITRNLGCLLSEEFPSVSSLLLSGCVLGPQDFSHLAQASVNGKLPELKHLDVSHNMSDLDGLFEYPCKWGRLEYLNIENEPNATSGPTSNPSSLDILAKKVRSGCLGSLRELRFTAGDGNYYPRTTRNLRWSSLSTLHISHAGNECSAVLEPIAHAVEDGQFPLLSVVRVACKLSPEGQGRNSRVDSENLAKVRFRLRKQGVRVFYIDGCV